MSKHTPGPWSITHEGYKHNGDYAHQIGTQECTVAYTWCPCDYSPPPAAMVANARLIAAAPELYAALKEILAIKSELSGGDWDEIDRARGIAFIALAKVESA